LTCNIYVDYIHLYESQNHAHITTTFNPLLSLSSYPQLLPHGRSDHLREVHLIRGPPSACVAAGAAHPAAAAVQPTLAVPLMALPVAVVPLLQLVGRVLVLPAGVDRVPGGGPPVRRRRRSNRPRFPTPEIREFFPIRDWRSTYLYIHGEKRIPRPGSPTKSLKSREPALKVGC
jgi:hypothetical protein